MDRLLVDSSTNRLVSEIYSAATSETSAKNEDQEMEDAATSNLGTLSVVSLLVDWIFLSNFGFYLQLLLMSLISLMMTMRCH